MAKGYYGHTTGVRSADCRRADGLLTIGRKCLGYSLQHGVESELGALP